MALSFYTTQVPSTRSAAQITNLLAQAGASAILTEYNGDKSVEALIFKVNTPSGELPFRLPLNLAGVARTLQKQVDNHPPKAPRSVLRNGQSERIAWRILVHWLEAQLAMIEVGQAQLEQVMLPYMSTGLKETLYDRMQSGGFKALMAPQGE